MAKADMRFNRNMIKFKSCKLEDRNIERERIQRAEGGGEREREREGIMRK